MPDKLPIGWTKTTLGEIVEPSRERALPAEAPTVPYVGLEHIQPHTMKLVGHAYGRDVRSSAIRFSKGDILYARMRPYLNKIWIAAFDGICSAEFLVFAQRHGINNTFVATRLSAEDFVSFANGRVSGERPRVGFAKLKHFPVWLPPLAEQEKIASKLNAALSAVERARAATGRAQNRLIKYRDAVLDAAITGQLTREWRKREKALETGGHLLSRLLRERRTRWEGAELARIRPTAIKPAGIGRESRYPKPAASETVNLPKLPRGWIWASAEQLTEATRPITYGVIKLGAEVKGGIPILRSSDVRPLRIDLNRVKRISSEIADSFRRTYLEGGEVLVTVRGTLGGVAVVPNECIGYNISREVAMLALVEQATSRIVAYFIASPILQRWLRDRTRGIAYTGINIETLRTLPIPVPPLSEQAQVVREVEQRMSASDRLAATLEQQMARATTSRESFLRDAFLGRLVPQNSNDEPASVLIRRIRSEKQQTIANRQRSRQGRLSTEKNRRSVAMHQSPPSTDAVMDAWRRIGKSTDARRLFDEAGFIPEQATQFYEMLRTAPDIRHAFQKATQTNRVRRIAASYAEKNLRVSTSRFRLMEFWLEDFKNLKNYTIRFDPSQGINVVLGWNGTGKSNLFEALVIVFRDLHDWWEKNRWPEKPMTGFRLRYEIDEHIVEVNWRPNGMKRPEVKRALVEENATHEIDFSSIRREELPLPRFVFGYYSGPTNRLAEHFLPMKQAHYDRLRLAKADDAKTLAKLLEQRQFFCAETHHAKYVLLGFSYKEDPKISEFLEKRLRIVGFESALFIIRKPPWAKSGSKAEEFWGATGIMRRVMERLRRYAVAPMVFEQRVSYGYRSTIEDHYYFFLPDLDSLQSFASEYQDARTFFLALESTDFSELIHDVKIQVRVKSTNAENVPITFHQLSEGEQQLLMVLGLMRFTKSHQSLVLLDEPDTHLNPHWSVDYLKDLARVMSDSVGESSEQHSSQIVMATHDPLVIASLVKEQIHLLKRDPESGACKWEQPSVNPRGLGFTGILTSEMFGFRSDLDPETLADLDDRVRLVSKDGPLSQQEKSQLEAIDRRLVDAGFSKAFSDPYYSAFVRAWGRKYSEAMAGQQFLTPEKRQEIDRIASEVLAEAKLEVDEKLEADGKANV
jgi:restriction endonuclease S subunit/predicted ATPase